MSDYIPDPDQPEKVAISPDGGLAYGVRFGPARTDGSAPTVAELDAMAFLGWANAEQFGSMNCAAELCRNWTGMGCICAAAIDIEPDVVCGKHSDFPADDCPLCMDDEETM